MNARGLILGAFSLLLVGATAPARAGIVITIDKASQEMTVAVDGVPRYHWPVSTGKSGYITPSGNFTPFRMEVDHYSKEWDDAPMPHSIFFTKDGHAIHGTLEARRLGTPASHGCVRLSTQHAATLFALVKEEGMANTKVVLRGQTGTAVAKRGAAERRREARRAPQQIEPRQAQRYYGEREDPQAYYAQRYPRYYVQRGQTYYVQPNYYYGQRRYVRPYAYDQRPYYYQRRAYPYVD